MANVQVYFLGELGEMLAVRGAWGRSLMGGSYRLVDTILKCAAPWPGARYRDVHWSASMINPPMLPPPLLPSCRYGESAAQWQCVDKGLSLGQLLAQEDYVVPGVPLLFAVAKGTECRTRFLAQAGK